jgi:hypothetical protein
MGFLSAFSKRPSSDRQQSIDRLTAQIAGYLERLEVKGGSLEERSLTLIARSPSAAVSRALALQAKEFEKQQISMRLIFARLAPFELLADLASALNLTSLRQGRSSPVRLIRTPAVLHAHEQLVLGLSTCWTGDMMRRCEENRNGLDLWENNAPGSVRLAELAFNAIWSIAKPVPARILTGPSAHSLPARTPMAPAIAAAGLASEGGLNTGTGSTATRH